MTEASQTYHRETGLFKYSFFPFTISESNNLDLHVCKARSLLFSKDALLKTVRAVPSPYFNVYNPVWLKLLTRRRVGLSHLNEHKFKHDF